MQRGRGRNVGPARLCPPTFAFSFDCAAAAACSCPSNERSCRPCAAQTEDRGRLKTGDHNGRAWCALVAYLRLRRGRGRPCVLLCNCIAEVRSRLEKFLSREVIWGKGGTVSNQVACWGMVGKAQGAHVCTGRIAHIKSLPLLVERRVGWKQHLRNGKAAQR